jgi:hypothetical protein
MTAYDRALADYNEQVSAAQIQAGVEIQGRNPDFNRKIECEEIKKGCASPLFRPPSESPRRRALRGRSEDLLALRP